MPKSPMFPKPVHSEIEFNGDDDSELQSELESDLSEDIKKIKKNKFKPELELDHADWDQILYAINTTLSAYKNHNHTDNQKERLESQESLKIRIMYYLKQKYPKPEF